MRALAENRVVSHRPAVKTRRPGSVRRKPGTVARGASLATLGIAPILLGAVALSGIFGGRSVGGRTSVELQSFARDASGASGFAAEGAAVRSSSVVTVDVDDSRIDAAYYLGSNLVHGLAALLVVLAVVTALGVLRRRPVSLATVAVTGFISLYCAVAAFAAPWARGWAIDRVVEDYGLPTSVEQSQSLGVGFHVAAPHLNSFTWTAGLLGCALVALGATLWALHLRRLLGRR